MLNRKIIFFCSFDLNADGNKKNRNSIAYYTQLHRKEQPKHSKNQITLTELYISRVRFNRSQNAEL